MTPDITQTLLRSILKLAAGSLIARGWGTNEDWEIVIGAIVAIGSVAWGIWHQKQKPSSDAQTPKEVTNQ